MTIIYTADAQQKAVVSLYGSRVLDILRIGLFRANSSVTINRNTPISSLSPMPAHPPASYAMIVLTPALWSFTAGNPSFAQVNTADFRVGWTFTASLGEAFGYYLTYGVSSDYFAAQRFATGPFTVLRSGDSIDIVPRISLD